jgi:hypothetical protein
MMPPAKQRPASMQSIRLSLLIGVLMFGAVSLFIHRQPNWTAGTVPTAVVYAFVPYAILAVLVAAVLRGRVGREPDLPRRATLLLIGWAVGESAGLFGTIIYYVNNQAQWWALGILAMLASFAMLSPSAAAPATGNLDAPG